MFCVDCLYLRPLTNSEVNDLSLISASTKANHLYFFRTVSSINRLYSIIVACCISMCIPGILGTPPSCCTLHPRTPHCSHTSHRHHTPILLHSYTHALLTVHTPHTGTTPSSSCTHTPTHSSLFTHLTQAPH